jgi:isochorismate synthase
MPSRGTLRADSAAVEDPGDLLALAGASRGLPVFYWERPAWGVGMVALGMLREIRVAGPERFVRASAAARALFSSIESDGASGARVVGGFGFSDRDPTRAEWRDFPAARLVLPQLMWTRQANHCVLTRIWEVGGEGDRDRLLERVRGAAVTACRSPAETAPLVVAGTVRDERQQWRARVETVRALIASGGLSKVVVARRRELLADGPIDPARMLAAARAARPACFNYWVSHGGSTSFIGSTPELLVRCTGDRVEASALAGSAARGADRDEDRRLGEMLLSCPKNGREHALVVSAVRAALEDIADRIVSPARPEILVLPEAQHLHTRVSGRLADPRTVVEVAGALHPTPAVCGVPREAARALIEREESERGWYAGAVGWMAANGDGELAVALRSALLDDRRIAVWAGAGIVEGSNPDTELAETETKMTALFRGLAGDAGDRAA